MKDVEIEKKIASEIADLAKKVKNANILGTLFCIYNEPKQIAKLDKYLPEHVLVKVADIIRP